MEVDIVIVALVPFYVFAVAVTGKVVLDLFSSADKLSITEMLSGIASALKK